MTVIDSQSFSFQLLTRPTVSAAVYRPDHVVVAFLAVDLIAPEPEPELEREPQPEKMTSLPCSAVPGRWGIVDGASSRRRAA